MTDKTVPEKKFHEGRMTHDNIPRIVNRLLEMFRGKVWSVASLIVNYDRRIQLLTNNVLRNSWSGGSKDLVIIHEDGIRFSGGKYVYTFHVNAKEPDKSPHFAFDRCDMLEIKEPTRHGGEHLETFCVQCSLDDTDGQYDRALLKAHFPEGYGEAKSERETLVQAITEGVSDFFDSLDNPFKDSPEATQVLLERSRSRQKSEAVRVILAKLEKA